MREGDTCRSSLELADYDMFDNQWTCMDNSSSMARSFGLQVNKQQAFAAGEQAQDNQYTELRQDGLRSAIGRTHLASQSYNY